MFIYPATVHHETGSVWISCDDVPEFSSAGNNEFEALLNAVDGLESALSLYVEQHRPIPSGSPTNDGRPVIHIRALTAAKAALWNAMCTDSVTKADMAGRLCITMHQMEHLVNPLHRSKIEQVEHALSILGRRIVFSVSAV